MTSTRFGNSLICACRIVVTSSFLLALPQLAMAQHEGDVLFGIEDGRLSIVTPITEGDIRKFDVNGDGTVFVSDDPGYNTIRFGTLRSGDEIVFEFATPLYSWTDDRWSPAGEGDYLSYYDQPFSESRFVTATGKSGVEEGYVLERATALGAIHVHDLFEIGNTGGGAPLAGAYAIGKRLLSPQYESSDTFFVVMNNGLPFDLFDHVLASAEAFFLNPEEPGLAGDFDGNGELTAIDIDLLSAVIRDGSQDAQFDLTSDGLTNESDRLRWVEIAGTLLGDATLDGVVTFPDFLRLSAGFGQSGGWAEGDFDGSGEIAFPDFLLLSDNFGQVRGKEVTHVPEPNSAHTVAVVFILIVVHGVCTRKRIWHAY